MRRLLGLPIATPLGSRLMLAHIHRRKTGKLYKQPISYVQNGDILLTPGGGKWKLNLAPATPVRLRIRDHLARPELAWDQAEVTRLLGIMSAANSALERFVPPPEDPIGKPDQQALAQAIRHGFCIVRRHLNPTAAAALLPSCSCSRSARIHAPRQPAPSNLCGHSTRECAELRSSCEAAEPDDRAA
ncbi:hypothetical protein ACFY2M_35265 [Streptomyces sp. NPDC001276]|uniref:hypothetical protein n=1 Tax=Streptomyces sp. NPDC001276 TaxID=3364555 RepID=UPI00367AF902